MVSLQLGEFPFSMQAGFFSRPISLSHEDRERSSESTINYYRPMEQIKTEYKGCDFESELEARWAVFFEVLGLDWVYEPDGFELADGVEYMPDFKVLTPYHYNFLYEIRHEGEQPDPYFEAFEEFCKAKQVDEYQKHYPHLLRGDPRWAIFQGSYVVCPRCGGMVDQTDGMPTRRVYCWACDMHTSSGRNGIWQSGSLVVCRPYKGDVLINSPNGPDNSSQYRQILECATIKARLHRFGTESL